MSDVGELSPFHLLFVLVIALVVIGPGKLPEVGTALGKTIREFRKATSEVQTAVKIESAPITAGVGATAGTAATGIAAPETNTPAIHEAGVVPPTAPGN